MPMSWCVCKWSAASANVCSWLVCFWTWCMHDEYKHELQRADRAAVYWICAWTCKLYDMIYRCLSAACNYLLFHWSCIFFITFVTSTCFIFSNCTASMCFEFVNGCWSNHPVCTTDDDTFWTAAAYLVVERVAHEDGIETKGEIKVSTKLIYNIHTNDIMHVGYVYSSGWHACSCVAFWLWKHLARKSFSLKLIHGWHSK